MWQRGNVRAVNYIFSMDKEKKTINWEQVFLIQYRILSAVKRVEFVSDRV
jgi:hypothetical protein